VCNNDSRPAPDRTADPLDALLRRAVRQAPPGRARDWLLALLERGESAEMQGHTQATAGAADWPGHEEM
jgi:hypothetical protein